ncbi:hypothetical protein P22_0991 [Propionispora sp. 2/2-37]|uniref:class II aldolase/adducin family protein n=1 Tax=Propionispora sp. 2/2-37 TaxID=1677858 RepID=UPI0006BB5E4A|nr:class II aldolase/adducin family protein [Propionispora sp. 2/2-37]CUH94922.1 hypothetical protein P22_0991 [Propionispora sp. 2/2-37]
MLEELKKEVVAIARQAEASGLCRHKSGNFSIRDEKTGYVVVTPAGVGREELTYYDICVVDGKANVLEAIPGRKPTSELLLHLKAYAIRPEVMAGLHTHSRFATAFAVVNKEIPAIVYEGAALGGAEGIIPVAPYGRPGTSALAESITGPIKKADAALLESHGVITVAENAKDALLKAHYVEEIAEIYYRALMISGGKEPAIIAPEEFAQWQYPPEFKLHNHTTKA